MRFQKGTILDLTVEKLAFEGFGIAKTRCGDRDNFVVFVDGAVPGDKIRGEVFKSKKQFAHVRIKKLVEPSIKRIEPRCKHFDTCGGCTFQFLDYEEQLIQKESFVSEALKHIGGLSNVRVKKIIPAPNPWFYRNKMEYSFGLDTSGHLTLGLHPPRRFYEVFDLQECFLESEVSVAILQFVREWCVRHKLSIHHLRRNEGLLQNLIVREARATGERMIILVTSGDNFPQVQELSRELCDAFPSEISSIYHNTITRKKGSRTKIEENLLWGKDVLTERLSVKHPKENSSIELTFDIKPQAFFQPNPQQAETLYSTTLAFADAQPDDIVYDLFCGTGTIGMFFASVSKRVYGIELNESAIATAESNARANGIENTKFIAGDVGEKIFELKERPNIVVIDPPRAGLTPKALEKIQELAPPKIVYVSCNPATLARDLKGFAKDYKIEKVQPVDLFPQTYHVENVALLLRK